MEILAQGGSSLVEWRLETGRTHQVRSVNVFLLRLLQMTIYIYTYYNPSTMPV